jgi:ATP-dependent Clp protease adapter protein ClpS
MNSLRRLRAWFMNNTVPPFIPDGMTFPCVNLKNGESFVHGIELLNDPLTPILFANKVLQEIVKLPQKDAAAAVAICHNKGGVLISMKSAESAAAVIDQVRLTALQEAWPLKCRAVSLPTRAISNQAG